jgi:hypothetical protein
VLVSSCESEAEKLFEDLCRREAGIEIKEVVNADGFFDTQKSCPNCWAPIIENGYKFVEVCIEKNSIGRVKLEKGCWNFHRAERNDPNCREDIAEVTDFSIKKKGGDYCIVAKKIDRPTSAYEKSFDENIVYESTDKNKKVSKQKWTITSLVEDKIIAEQINFQLYEDFKMSGGLNKPCRITKNHKIDHNFWRQVILVNSNQQIQISK